MSQGAEEHTRIILSAIRSWPREDNVGPKSMTGRFTFTCSRTRLGLLFCRCEYSYYGSYYCDQLRTSEQSMCYILRTLKCKNSLPHPLCFCSERIFQQRSKKQEIVNLDFSISGYPVSRFSDVRCTSVCTCAVVVGGIGRSHHPGTCFSRKTQEKIKNQLLQVPVLLRRLAQTLTGAETQNSGFWRMYVHCLFRHCLLRCTSFRSGLIGVRIVFLIFFRDEKNSQKIRNLGNF